MLQILLLQIKTMDRYCISCKKNTVNKRTKQNRFMLVPNFAACGKRKSKFTENHDTCGLELH